MPLPKVIDTGTPLRESAETVALTIDGRTIRVAKGTSIMAAARSHGIEPTPAACSHALPTTRPAAEREGPPLREQESGRLPAP